MYRMMMLYHIYLLATVPVLLLIRFSCASDTTNHPNNNNIRRGTTTAATNTFWTTINPETRQEQEIPNEERRCPAAAPWVNDNVNNPQQPWDPLTLNERRFVSALLSERLNLNRTTEYLDADQVRTVDLEEPDKAQTLRYLDDGGTLPDRYARATVSFGSMGPRYVVVYRVGPLPAELEDSTGNDVTIENLTPTNEADGEALPMYSLFLSGNSQTAVGREISRFLNHETTQAFLSEAFVPRNSMQWYTHQAGVMRNRTESIHISWYRSYSSVDNLLSYPLPLACIVDIIPDNYDNEEGTTWTTTLHSILYRDQFFPTQQDFFAALENGGVTIVPTEQFTNNPEWQTLNERPNSNGRPETANNAPPAVNAEPGARIQRIGRRFTWLGWSLYVVNRPTTSLAVYDMTFGGQRIAYEISIQDLWSVYTGNTPHMANKFLFDGAFRFGQTNRDLVPGVDCPESAMFLGNTCVFEHDTGYPLWRKDGGRRWYAGARATQLVVRSVMEVGNYDFLVYVHFNLDGQIEAGIGATGQLFMSYYMPEEEPFGTRVHEEALANLHIHYGAFKVDLDVLDRNNNCVERESIVYRNRADIPNAHTNTDDSFDLPTNSMAIERTLVENENDARVVVDNTQPTNWKIVSCDETNRWGYLRGYEIVHPNTPLAIYDDFYPGIHSYHTVFAQRKETEPYLTAPMDMMIRATPMLPVVGDGGISNGESLRQQDVVAWVSLGFTHLPRAEDNPVTNTITAKFVLRPFNYFDENPSLDLGQTARSRRGEQTDAIPSGNCVVEV